MLTFLSILSGVCIAVMLVQNGDLSAVYGNYHATAMIHGVGLVCILLWMLIKGERPRLRRDTPWAYYAGGALGVLTVVWNNLCYPALGASLTLALSLLGQCLASGAVDHFGWFGLAKTPFRKQHLLSFGIIMVGIVIMIIY